MVCYFCRKSARRPSQRVTRPVKVGVRDIPAEGFVLGGAFLLHDLGMALPAVEGGIAALKKDPRWADLVTYEYTTVYDRQPSPELITDPEKEITGDGPKWTIDNSSRVYYIV